MVLSPFATIEETMCADPIRHTLSDGLPTGRGPFSGSQFPAGSVAARSTSGGVGGGDGDGGGEGGGGDPPPPGFLPSDLSSNARWYLHDEGAGTTIADSSVHGDDVEFGPVTDDPVWTATPTVDYVDQVKWAGFAAPFRDTVFDGPFTIFIVAKGGADGKLLSGGQGAGIYMQMSIKLGKLQIGTESAGQFWIEDSTNSIDQTDWFSVAATMDHTAGRYTVLDGYIGGVEETMIEAFKSVPPPAPPALNELRFNDADWHGSVVGFAGEVALAVVIPTYFSNNADILALHTWAATELAGRGISL